MRQVGIGKTVRSPRFSGVAVDVSLLNKVTSKPGLSRSAGMSLAGVRFSGQAVSGM